MNAYFLFKVCQRNGENCMPNPARSCFVQPMPVSSAATPFCPPMCLSKLLDIVFLQPKPMPYILAREQNSQSIARSGWLQARPSPRSFVNTMRVAFRNANWNSLFYRLAREVSLFILDLILTQALLVRNPMEPAFRLRRLFLPVVSPGKEASGSERLRYDRD